MRKKQPENDDDKKATNTNEKNTKRIEQSYNFFPPSTKFYVKQYSMSTVTVWQCCGMVIV